VGWADVPACRKQGWTQPSRAGWADVPAHRRNKKKMTGYCCNPFLGPRKIYIKIYSQRRLGK